MHINLIIMVTNKKHNEANRDEFKRIKVLILRQICRASYVMHIAICYLFHRIYVAT